MASKKGDGLAVPDSWTVAPLREFLSLITYGFTNPMPTTSVGPFMITAKDIHSGRISYSTARHTSQEAYDQRLTAKSRPLIGDVLLTKDGSIGRVAICDRTDICINQSVALLRSNGRIIPRFLAYLLQAPNYQRQMDADADGSTIKHIYITRVDKMKVAVPPEAEQLAITELLGLLDDRIAVLYESVHTLEEIAQTIFKSWFVDFDPVKAKAEGREPEGMDAETGALFPNGFQESKLGSIPKGWSVEILANLTNRVSMGPFGSDIKTSNFLPQGVPVIRGKNLGNGFIDDDFVYVSDGKADSLKNANARADDIVITHRGTLGQVGIIPVNSRFPRYVVSQSQMVLTADREKITPHFLYHFLISEVGQNQLLANANQTGVPAIASPTSSVKSIKVPHCTTTGILETFESIAVVMANRISLSVSMARTLSAIRDTLLPKLMFGQIRVSQAEALVESAV